MSKVGPQPAPETQVLDLAGGVTLRVDVRGEGTPVLLLHGFTGDASTMEMLAEPLAVDHRVIVPNLIGHGGSTGQSLDDYSVDVMVDQMIEVLDCLEPDALLPVNLVGYSMGGRVALTLACRFPERVRSLSLIGASAGLPDAADRSSRTADDDALAESIETEGLEPFVDRWMANPLFATQARLGVDRLAEFRAQRLRNDGVELARSLRAAGTGQMRPLHDELPACPVPTMLVVGEEDEKFTAIAADLMARLPDCDLGVVPGVGHAAHLEDPGRVLALIHNRIGSQSGSGAPAALLRRCHLPLRSPLITARGSTSVRDTILYSISAGRFADGQPAVGWGEAAPLPGWSRESLDDCEDALSVILLPTPSGLGDSHLWAGPAGKTILASLADVPSARAAVAGAMFDLSARCADQLLRDHLAGLFATTADVSESVEVNGVVSAASPDDVTEEVSDLLDRGFTTIKLKVASGPIDGDVARVAAAREVAPHAALRIDANGGWDHVAAVDALRRLAEFDIHFCEEPVVGIEAIAAIGAMSSVPVPVAVDESARTVADLEQVWTHAEASEIATVVIKPQALGGPDVAMAAIADARHHGVDVVITTMIDSAVGVAHAAHVAAAAGLPGAHGLDTARLLSTDVAAVSEALPVEDGRLWFAAERGTAERRRWGTGLGIGPVSPPPASSS